MVNTTDITELQRKWDQRYAQSNCAGSACWVLEQHRHLLPCEGKSLDLACGLGANALLLAQCGLESHGWDISLKALNQLNRFAQQQQLTVHTQLRNVEQEPPPSNSFDVIVVSQFLYRPLFPALLSALKPNGLLFYQTFNQQKLTKSGPSSQRFLLTHNELLSLLSPLRLVFYREDADIGRLEHGLRDCSYFVGKKSV